MHSGLAEPGGAVGCGKSPWALVEAKVGRPPVTQPASWLSVYYLDEVKRAPNTVEGKVVQVF
jgi:hypothetical protein